MPRGKGTSDKVQNAIEQICLLDEEINRKIDELYNVKQEIMFAIATVENPIDRRCMYLRFVEMKSLGEIARELGKPRNSIPFHLERGIKSTRCCINT
jgi:DNA-directed RNA polymerase specialized sigma24 family protein